MRPELGRTGSTRKTGRACTYTLEVWTLVCPLVALNMPDGHHNGFDTRVCIGAVAVIVEGPLDLTHTVLGSDIEVISPTYPRSS